MRFPAKITSSCISVAIPVDWVILHCYACVADGRSLGRAVYGHVITKFSGMGRLLHFLTHGAPRARLARESSAITFTLCFSVVYKIEFWSQVWHWPLLRVKSSIKLFATGPFFLQRVVSFSGYRTLTYEDGELGRRRGWITKYLTSNFHLGRQRRYLFCKQIRRSWKTLGPFFWTAT